METGNEAGNQAANQTVNISDTLPSFFAKIEHLITYIYDKALEAAPWFVMIALLISGYLYITGNRDGGKKALIAAITGLVIIILSAAIVRIINFELQRSL